MALVAKITKLEKDIARLKMDIGAILAFGTGAYKKAHEVKAIIESVYNSAFISAQVGSGEVDNIVYQVYETVRVMASSDSELGSTSEDEDPTTSDEDAITESSGSETSSSEDEAEAQFTSDSE